MSNKTFQAIGAVSWIVVALGALISDTLTDPLWKPICVVMALLLAMECARRAI